MVPFGLLSSIAVAASAAMKKTLEVAVAATVKTSGEILGLMMPSSPNTTCGNRPPSTGGWKMVSPPLIYHMTLTAQLMMFPYQ